MAAQKELQRSQLEVSGVRALDDIQGNLPCNSQDTLENKLKHRPDPAQLVKDGILNGKPGSKCSRASLLMLNR